MDTSDEEKRAEDARFFQGVVADPNATDDERELAAECLRPAE
jgi:hypothetical protein